MEGWKPSDLKLIKVCRLARALDVHTATVQRWCLTGVGEDRLPSCRIGRSRYVDVDDFLDWMRRQNPAVHEDRRGQASSVDIDRRLDELAVTTKNGM